MDSLLPSDPVSIDGYVIEGRLGSGGFGIVYGATSPDGRPVAVKVLRPELSDDLRLRERLAREADAIWTGRLQRLQYDIVTSRYNNALCPMGVIRCS